ncbi:MBL fold metallo-hydrolase [Streptomyces tremellae]|uniref:MBL fold metallo-hydrolase n=1 Tax=Streptomyces tremellae TaxID=1124239 RepID=A0ABP7EW37_9ACTN
MSAPVLSTREPAPPAHIDAVADGIYAYVQPHGGWCVSNSGIIVGDRLSALIDSTATERRARSLRGALTAVTETPPRILINTHSHGDHTFGNAVFAPEATIVAHHLARDEMIENGEGLKTLWSDVDWGVSPVVPPDLTFTDRMQLHVGGHDAHLLHVGPAHTTNDTVVWLPEQRVLFAGDVLWNGVTPFVMMGSVSGALRAVSRLRALEPLVVVPGHGAVGGPEILDATEAYLSWLLDLARTGLRDGTTPLELARRTDLGRFGRLLDPERLVGNLHRAAAELAGLPEGAALPVPDLFAELVQFNGGRPLRCCA